MTYRIEIAAQGSNKPFAYHSRDTLMAAHDCANRLRKRLGKGLTITVKESN